MVSVSVLSFVNFLVTSLEPIWTLCICGCLIDKVCSWVLVWYPLAKYSASAELEPGSNILALPESVVILIVLFPVVNTGLLVILGSGICKEKIKSPFSSLNNAKSWTVASAVPDSFTISIPLITYPLFSTLFSNDKSAVSIFNTSLVLEYADDNVVVGYGKLVIVSSGSLYGPSLWLRVATLNLISGVVVNSLDCDILSTISLTAKVPFTILIGRYLGTAYFVKSVFSMKT